MEILVTKVRIKLSFGKWRILIKVTKSNQWLPYGTHNSSSESPAAAWHYAKSLCGKVVKLR